MQTQLHVALSAQISLQKRLDTIANNVANASTVGFRAEEVKFETLLSQASNTSRRLRVRRPELSFARLGRAGAHGRTSSTSRSRAMPGSASRHPPGPVYTRDGRIKMTAHRASCRR